VGVNTCRYLKHDPLGHSCDTKAFLEKISMHEMINVRKEIWTFSPIARASVARWRQVPGSQGGQGGADWRHGIRKVQPDGAPQLVSVRPNEAA